MPNRTRTAKRRFLNVLLVALTGAVVLPSSDANAADFSVGNFNDLQSAIIAINAGNDTDNGITLTGDITLSDPLRLINIGSRNINIVGGDHTLSGGDSTRILFVESGTVNVSRLVLQDGNAAGGNGGAAGSSGHFAGGGGGGLGAGGAIFVDANATVTLRAVTFEDNRSVGGAGGGLTNASRGGGGGGGLGGDGGDSGADSASGGGGGLNGSGGTGSTWMQGGGGGGQFGRGADGIDSFAPYPSGGNQYSEPTGENTGGNGGSGDRLMDGADYGGGVGGTDSNHGGDGGKHGGGGGTGSEINYGQGGHGGEYGGGGGSTEGVFGGTGGNGGFGGGGGGGGGYWNPSGESNEGKGGFGAGDGGAGNDNDGIGGEAEVGQGGQAMGGAIFVRDGGTLIIYEGTSFSGSTVTGGLDGNGANQRTALGDGLYLHTGVVAQFNVAEGETTVLDDSISGAGGFIKSGAGTLKLGAATNNDPQAVTEVMGGSLIVDGTLSGNVNVQTDATLGGRGTLGDVTVSGRLKPGNSINTQTFSSLALQDSSITTIELKKSNNPAAGTDNDLISVTNTVTIGASATLHVTAENATENLDRDFTEGVDYTFMQADTIAGAFSNVTDDLAFYRVLLSYDTNVGGDDFARLSLEFSEPDFIPFASTSNQIGLANSLNYSMDHGGVNWTTLAGLAAGLTNSQASSLLHQGGASSFASSSSVQVQSGSLVVGTVAGQIRGAMPGVSFGGSSTMGGGSFAAASPVQSSVANSAISLVSYIDNGGGDFSRPVTADTYRPTQRRQVSQWSGWVLGYGLGGSAETDGNASGLHFGLGGLTAGISRQLDASHQIGFFGGYVGSNTTGQATDFSIQTDSGQFGAYLTGQDSTGYYLMLGGFQFDGYDSERNIAAGPITETAAADYDGWQAFTYGERGWNFQSSDRTTLQPYAGLQYIHVSQDAFTENGAGALNLAVDDVDADSLRSVLGARLITSLGDHGWRQYVTPQAHVGWMHEFLDTSTVAGAQFAGVGGSGFVSAGLDLGRDFVIAGGGVNLQLTESLTSSVNYITQVNEHQDLHVGSLLMTYQW